MWPDNRIIIIVQHAYLDNRSSLPKTFWNKYAKLKNFTVHAAPCRAATDDKNWPACHRRHNDAGLYTEGHGYNGDDDYDDDEVKKGETEEHKNDDDEHEDKAVLVLISSTMQNTFRAASRTRP